MASTKDIAQRRNRHNANARTRDRVRWGIGIGVDMTPDPLDDPELIGANDGGPALELDPLRVALAERVSR